jgi:hypothetical protein
MLKKHLFFRFFSQITPFEGNDYFEPRVEGKVFKTAPKLLSSFWISSNYAKKFAFDFGANYLQNTDNETEIGCFISPRWRINDKWFTLFQISYQHTENEIGFIEHNEQEDTIFFGSRNLKTYTNLLQFSYVPNNKMGFNFRLRHYWSTVKYNSFFILNEQGYNENYDEYTENQDISFNAFTIDFDFKWNFAPGSGLSLVWKNGIFNSSDAIIHNYFENTSDLFKNSTQNNSISLRILYYLDYLYLKRK